jgi:hypothetical protein
MRTASLIMLSGLFVQVAHAADQIRLSTFPNVMLGTWAETAQQCAVKDKSNVVIEPAKYGDGDGSHQLLRAAVRPGRAEAETFPPPALARTCAKDE